MCESKRGNYSNSPEMNSAVTTKDDNDIDVDFVFCSLSWFMEVDEITVCRTNSNEVQGDGRRGCNSWI